MKKNETLETVEQYEQRKSRERQAAKEAAKRTGIACPECGKEMAWMKGCYQKNWAIYQLARCLSCGTEREIEK